MNQPLRGLPVGPTAGRNRRASLRLIARERRRESQHLADALEDGRLRLTHTPRIRLADGIHVADQTTIYWPRADLSPAASLTTTGSGDITRRIASWSLRAACASAAVRPDGPLVSVPIPVALLGPTLPTEVDAALRASQIAPRRLELRLSELALVDPTRDLLQCLGSLAESGVRLALDDFGMRHGSTTLLRHLPLDAIHLDPSLTHDPEANAEDAAVIGALTAMAHALGLQVIARAIDSVARRASLTRIGVDQGMGQCCNVAMGGADEPAA